VSWGIGESTPKQVNEPTVNATRAARRQERAARSGEARGKMEPTQTNDGALKSRHSSSHSATARLTLPH